MTYLRTDVCRVDRRYELSKKVVDLVTFDEAIPCMCVCVVCIMCECVWNDRRHEGDRERNGDRENERIEIGWEKRVGKESEWFDGMSFGGQKEEEEREN